MNTSMNTSPTNKTLTGAPPMNTSLANRIDLNLLTWSTLDEAAQRAHKGTRAAAAGNRLARGQRLGKPTAGLVHHLLTHTYAPSSHIDQSGGNRRPTASNT